ncbi:MULTISPECIES: glycosyltransferase [unclassified Mesorhizobium]|uniref:glycosyltransferase n=1 Tax=unclassified Mesorhizobium TaxID=325217 RepID=UPI001CC91FBE|nr:MULTISPECIES: glycosyltransferase [unclassified Mesorhizobium]MBZ9737829.1 glycosyltransferase [Mesorhizobium sp. CO1-1-4]MBZ9801983.1 glycosyltransferase [Mesorhizobium sp. ES1-6]
MTEPTDASVTNGNEQAASPPTLAIDATGLMLWPPGKGLAGIPRVESFLVNAALADPDPCVEAVAFRSSEGKFRPLAPYELDHVAVGPISPHQVKRWPGRRAALSQAFEAVRQRPWDKRETDRHLARTVTNGRKGVAYQATRLLIRAYRLCQRVRIRLGAEPHAPGRGTEAERGLVLISHHILTQQDRSAVSSTTGTLAFLCHDLIPTLRPDLIGTGIGETRFGSYLEQLVRSGAPAFCASDEVGATLTDHMRKAGIAAPVVYRFPMPSILHETAARMGATSRIETGEPFVIYCSTIEVRKNHILLARIWQQALEEGVKLPRLVCAGRWGWMIEPLRAYLKDHPALLNSVTFTGLVSDEELIQYYRSAAFGVFPSHIEGWGYGASECLDFGIPVIVSTAPSLIEASGGMMPAIDPNDQAGWYAAIRKMAEDHGWRSSLTERIARQHRPTPTSASWAAIKAGLRENAARRLQSNSRKSV